MKRIIFVGKLFNSEPLKNHRDKTLSAEYKILNMTKFYHNVELKTFFHRLQIYLISQILEK